MLFISQKQKETGRVDREESNKPQQVGELEGRGGEGRVK